MLERARNEDLHIDRLFRAFPYNSVNEFFVNKWLRCLRLFTQTRNNRGAALRGQRRAMASLIEMGRRQPNVLQYLQSISDTPNPYSSVLGGYHFDIERLRREFAEAGFENGYGQGQQYDDEALSMLTRRNISLMKADLAEQLEVERRTPMGGNKGKSIHDKRPKLTKREWDLLAQAVRNEYGRMLPITRQMKSPTPKKQMERELAEWRELHIKIRCGALDPFIPKRNPRKTNPTSAT